MCPGLNLWPCILPSQSSVLESLSLTAPLARMPACPGVEMSLSWSNGRSTPPLCKQRAGEAEFTWEYGPSLCPSQHICTMPSTQEKPDRQQRVSVRGRRVFQVGCPTLDGAWLLSWGRTSTSKGQNHISGPASTNLPGESETGLSCKNTLSKHTAQWKASDKSCCISGGSVKRTSVLPLGLRLHQVCLTSSVQGRHHVHDHLPGDGVHCFVAGCCGVHRVHCHGYVEHAGLV